MDFRGWAASRDSATHRFRSDRSDARDTARIELVGNGSVVLHTAAGSVEFRKPIAYQEIGGEKRMVDARYRLHAHNRVGFSLGRYDVAHPLVIDPILAVSTNLWGAANGVAQDAAGNIYVVGYTTKSGD